MTLLSTVKVLLCLSSLLTLCSCSTEPQVQVGVKIIATMSEQAGRGDLLTIMLHLSGSEEFPFVIDTGAPITSLDSSLEPKLGSCLSTGLVSSFGAEYEARIYKAPKLYLGKLPLSTSSKIATFEFAKGLSPATGRPVLGILGMDCLSNYCIQLDFIGRRMLFLDSKPGDLGKSFELQFFNEGQDDVRFGCPVIQHAGLVGERAEPLWIDTGDNLDGVAAAQPFREFAGASNLSDGQNVAWLPECVWEGQTYTNLVIQVMPDNRRNVMGLRFLARHLVTFDFPNRRLYLRRSSATPLSGDSFCEKVDSAIRMPANYLRNLQANAGLPGWPKEVAATLVCVYHQQGISHSQTFAFFVNGNPFVYDYEVARDSEAAPWRLIKSWKWNRSSHVAEQLHFSKSL